MARPRSDDPLVPLTLRVPSSVKDDFVAQARAEGVTRSDFFRRHVSVAEVRPQGKLPPRRREKSLAPVSGADPALLRQCAAWGNNLNQIARRVNESSANGVTPESIHVLTCLLRIERGVEQIAISAGRACT